MPSSGAYLVPGISKCCLIPKEKLPWSSKQKLFTLFETASSARVRNWPASSRRSVTTVAMGSPLRIPQSLIAFFASLVVGVLLVSWLSTFLAFSRGSPDFPVAMLIVTFSILMFNNGFVLATVSLVCIIITSPMSLAAGPFQQVSHIRRGFRSFQRLFRFSLFSGARTSREG